MYSFHACRTKNLLETRWGLGLSNEYFPPENVVRYSLVQYIGGALSHRSPDYT
jgi:hypothetical protein